MVKRVSLSDAECPVARSLDGIGDWWSLLIVRDAFDGARRFGEFQKSLRISKGILASRLQGLVALGVLAVTSASDGSAWQDYVLTPKGEALFPVIVALRQWGEAFCYRPGEPHSELVDRKDGKTLAPLIVRNADGEIIRARDTIVMKI
ncbi:winged helix-turn-helix transcriptional regulator [Gluconacetobacter diazotrophicus]|uniref:Putative transcriptional regulatory protein n=1 Tax=Gluconacetobacter diazotrophicus (strain ATCC 49037 / DSM 5601 / CCUG 37298 / CIP 103539 / LMG 7603 / PAl5) TaxID=272568 RepID=A9HCE4_GLUDA|nr:helix-turn-helix domain-containing protein [Gluconacetobacter diazotrophicus]CAP54935.1 putative transcriptional regulatory protein [Gluconacetobacter diazotrophicus PA1 5]